MEHNFNLFKRVIDWYLSKEALPYWCVLVIDCAIVLFCGYVAYFVDLGGSVFVGHFWIITGILCLNLFFYIIGFRIKHTYSGIIRYSSFEDLANVSAAMSIGTALSLISNYFVSSQLSWMPFNWKVLVMVFLAGTLLMVFERIIGKAICDGWNYRNRNDRISVFVYGTLSGAIGIAKGFRNEQNSRFNVKGFVSANDEVSEQVFLMGKRVYSNDVQKLIGEMKKLRVLGLVVSPLQVENFTAKQELIDKLTEVGIRIYMMQSPQLWDGKSDISQNQIHEVEVEDLLPRDKIEVNMEAIGSLLHGKRILITGAAGSIGSEMVKQVAQFAPEEMVLIDQAETPMHDVRLLMAREFPEIKSETIVTSITNKDHMEKLFAEHRPDYVFHAAAYKHVPMMEDNPGMAVQNNILGTRVIADLAVKYGTKKFVMISTDKAVNPTNVMGCSKRICEIYCQSLNEKLSRENPDGNHTQFVTTRFGNVLGSNGSVIPLFRKQIETGGPVTVTHQDIIRYFMLIPEACRLVLEAGTMGRGGEIFVFDMGKPVKIVDLAKRMIRLSGAKNIEIKFTGLRDGEKLFEEVLNDAETTKPTHHPKIMIASVRQYDYEEACQNEERLLAASYSFDDMEIVRIMKEIVPEYKSQSSKYEVLDK